MLVEDLFERNGERDEYSWHRDITAQQGVEQKYALVTQKGQVVRSDLTKAAVLALQNRPDLIKKYGKLFPKRT